MAQSNSRAILFLFGYVDTYIHIQLVMVFSKFGVLNESVIIYFIIVNLIQLCINMGI